MYRLLRYLRPYSAYVVLAVFLLFAQAFSQLALPSIMADIVDRGIRGGLDGVILSSGIRMIVMTIVGIFAAVGVGFAASRTSAGFTRDLRRALFEKVESFSLGEFDSLSSASLLTRTTNDVSQLQHVVGMSLRMMLFAPVMGIGSVVMAIRTSVSMSWILLLAVLLVTCVVALMFVIAMPRFRLVQKLVDRLNLIGREHLDGIMVIRAFGTEEFEKKRFSDANAELTRVNLFVNRAMAGLFPFMALIMNGTGLLVVWIGAHQIAGATLEVGQMMAYLQYSMHVIMSFLMMSMMFIMIPRAAVSADRIAEVLAVDPSVRDDLQPLKLNEVHHSFVEFRNVSFRYPGAEEDALQDVSFTASPGETVAIVGATGSGKTTLVNLIPRFYDVSAGSVLVFGIDVKKMMQEDLRARIGFIHQKATLFAGTIDSNIRYGKSDASDEEVAEAARVAQASEFIETLDEGFDSLVAEGGSNLSGGQSQRLAIARALVRKPDIYIFDDSFSALDARTDANLRSELHQKTSDAVVIVVSQRIGTVMHADNIIVLENGRVVGSGIHSELLMLCPLYREIAESQTGKGEDV